MAYLTDVQKMINVILDNLKNISRQVDCAIACISGGVDSTVSAILAQRALGEKIYPIFIDTGFMRINEAVNVARTLSELVKIEVYDFSEEFISRLEGIEDAEEKRIVFRDLFYRSVKKIADEKSCSWIVQGTIKADVDETRRGVKTQHNVLNSDLIAKYGLNVIEPLINLYKHEVRALAKYLGLPRFISERQPFPGPGLLIRTVGKLNRNKLELVKKLTSIVENALGDKGYSQYFPAVWEHNIIESSNVKDIEFDVYEVKVTGVSEGNRSYGHPVVVNRWPIDVDIYDLYKYFDTLRNPHILVKLAERNNGLYLVALRIVKTENFMVAEVPRMNLNELKTLANEILENSEVRAVAFDITPKPPATIEYE
ncbi:MAG: GMP synthase [Desulfurococcaceae archaeon]